MPRIMVSTGDFLLGLIDATSRRPLRAFKQGSKTFFEVEPDLEILIAMKRLQGQSWIVSSFVVDGEDLKYTITWPPGESTPDNFGWLERTNGVQNGAQVFRSIRMVKPPKNYVDGDLKADKYIPGKIEVNFYDCEIVPCSEKSCHGVAGPHVGGNVVDLPKDSMYAGKVVRSEAGSRTYQGDTEPSLGTFARRRNLLRSVDLYYCTAAGLVAIGVLEDSKTTHSKKRGQEQPPDMCLSKAPSSHSKKRERVQPNVCVSKGPEASNVVDLTKED